MTTKTRHEPDIGRRRGRPHRRVQHAALAALLGALAAAPASAELSSINDAHDGADPAASQQMGDGIEQSFSDLDAFLFPPWELEAFPAVDTSASCETIYRELNDRVPRTYSYRQKFTDNPVNAAIGALGTMWWPAWLLWSIPALATYRDNRHIANNKTRVVYLRQLLAEKECWLK